jgi:hypothetical protein
MPHSLIKEQEKQYNRRSMKISKAERFHQMVKKFRAFTCLLSDLLKLWDVKSMVKGAFCPKGKHLREQW